MHGVVALLDIEHSSKIVATWEELRAVCGLQGIWETPIPHFSWQIAEAYHYDDLIGRLEEIASQTRPFSVTTQGWDVFEGESPVVYVPVLKDNTLITLHGKIWEETSGFGQGVSAHYSPEKWIPHITLANKDVTHKRIDCVKAYFEEERFNWEIMIETFAIVEQRDGGVGILHRRFPLKKG